MSQEVLSQIAGWAADYGRTNGIDTTAWRVATATLTCMIAGIRSADQARGVSSWLENRGGLFTTVVEPLGHGASWSVVGMFP